MLCFFIDKSPFVFLALSTGRSSPFYHKWRFLSSVNLFSTTRLSRGFLFTIKDEHREMPVFNLAHPFKINPYRKFFRNRSVVFSQRIDLSLAMTGAKSCPRSFGLLLHACKRIYVISNNIQVCLIICQHC